MTTWTDTDLNYVAQLAYTAGRQHADPAFASDREAYDRGRFDALRKVGELDRIWRNAACFTDQRAVRDRLALFKQCAETAAERRNRTYTDYPGGPVDWETGLPVGPPGPVQPVGGRFGDPYLYPCPNNCPEDQHRTRVAPARVQEGRAA
ncbi:MAG: hypothetical protein M3N43_08385 [Actinomycetota bacterium]|nr:hypothetical protein [Actinomycetota bacterium]